MDSKEKGSYEGWNEVWKGQAAQGNINRNFCPDSPATLGQFWQKGYAIDLLNLIKGKNYSRFCELGSGRGTTSMHLSYHGNTDITLVDLAEDGLEIAKASFAAYKLPIPNIVVANVENTPLPSDSFDCIYNIGLLEHFEDPRPTLMEAFRLLKKDGMIFMPIVPELPAHKSFAHRLFFNPI